MFALSRFFVFFSEDLKLYININSKKIIVRNKEVGKKSWDNIV